MDGPVFKRNGHMSVTLDLYAPGSGGKLVFIL